MSTYFPEFHIILDSASNFVSYFFFSAWSVCSSETQVESDNDAAVISEIYY